MASIHISLDSSDAPPRVDVLSIPAGRAFLVVYLKGAALSVNIFDAAASAWAKAFAASLLEAAAKVDGLTVAPAAEPAESQL